MESQRTETPSGFEQALERLVLESFSEGHHIEDTWRITVPIADAPDWTVTIERSYSDDASPYRPVILEE